MSSTPVDRTAASTSGQTLRWCFSYSSMTLGSSLRFNAMANRGIGSLSFFLAGRPLPGATRLYSVPVGPTALLAFWGDRCNSHMAVVMLALEAVAEFGATPDDHLLSCDERGAAAHEEQDQFGNFLCGAPAAH